MRPKNLHKPVIEVYHANLLPIELGSFKRECPFCENGALLVRRDQKTLILEAEDWCVGCGQPVRYLDIKKMRLKEDACRTGDPITPKKARKKAIKFLQEMEKERIETTKRNDENFIPLPPPPPKKSGTIKVKLIYKGRSKPDLRNLPEPDIDSI